MVNSNPYSSSANSTTTAYQKAINLMEARGDPIGKELWNNIGALRQKLGRRVKMKEGTLP